MRLLFLILFELSCVTLIAQDTTKIITKKSVVTKRYASPRIRLLIDGKYKTTDRAFALFKPDQIIMRDERPPDQRGDTLVLTIWVKDKTNPGLLYFQNRAKLSYKDKLFEHGDLPDINPSYISAIEYFKSSDGQSDFVELKIFGEDYIPSKGTRFESQPEHIKRMFFDVDGSLYSLDEFNKLGFKPGELIFKGMISGKEAAAKYGDSKYAEGVSIYTKRK